MTTPLAQPAARQLWAALRMLIVMTVLSSGSPTRS